VTLTEDSVKTVAFSFGKLFADGQLHSREQITVALKGSTSSGAGIYECKTQAHAECLTFALEDVGVLTPVATLSAAGARQATADGSAAPCIHLPKNYELKYRFDPSAFVESGGVASLAASSAGGGVSTTIWKTTLPIVQFGRKKNAARSSTGASSKAAAKALGRKKSRPSTGMPGAVSSTAKKKASQKRPRGSTSAKKKPPKKTDKGKAAAPSSPESGSKRKGEDSRAARNIARSRSRSNTIPVASALTDSTNQNVE
jgi:hypothetical protein